MVREVLTRTKVERSPRNITKVGHSHVQSVVTNRMTVIFPVTFVKRDYVRSAVIVSGMMTKCFDVIYAVTRLVIPWAMGTHHVPRWYQTVIGMMDYPFAKAVAYQDVGRRVKILCWLIH